MPRDPRRAEQPEHHRRGHAPLGEHRGRHGRRAASRWPAEREVTVLAAPSGPRSLSACSTPHNRSPSPRSHAGPINGRQDAITPVSRAAYRRSGSPAPGARTPSSGDSNQRGELRLQRLHAVMGRFSGAQVGSLFSASGSSSACTVRPLARRPAPVFAEKRASRRDHKSPEPRRRS
jgi:hypothetical protein